MDSYFLADVANVPPAFSEALVKGFPQDGDPQLVQRATKPGAYLYYAVLEEMLNVIRAADIEPDPRKLDQVAQAIKRLGLPAGGEIGQILARGENGSADWTNQGNYSNVFSLETSTQLDESHFGSLIFAGLDAVGVVMTLPQSNAVAKGKKITISSNRAGATIKPFDGDHIRFGNFTNTENGFFLPAFSVVSLVSNGNGNWTAVSQVPSGINGANGYRIFPDGLAIVWGNALGTAPITITFPIPLAAAFCAVVSQKDGQLYGSTISYSITNTTITIYPSINNVGVERLVSYQVFGRIS